jgi:hypothetical protein
VYSILEEEERYPPGTKTFYIYVGICTCKCILIYYAIIVLTLFAGLMSGLTVGYLSIDKIDLEIK